jgi:hypothetical protein
MAKQTFTTGQVLTAAQMTSLQQTAMLGGAASAKTASYTLVAGDAGTAISMNNASATTITVNTALFAAGDTVQITNLGAGVCTITAGTATVNTSASLALAQYESGTLDFTSTSAAIFIKGAGAAATSGAYTSIATGTLSSTSTTISSIDQSYRNLYLVIVGPYVNIATSMTARINGISTSVYSNMRFNGSNVWTFTGNQDFLNLVAANLPTVAHSNTATLEILNYATTSIKRMSSGYNTNNADGAGFISSFNNFTDQTAVTSISLLTGNGTSTFGGGSYTLYGVK